MNAHNEIDIKRGEVRGYKDIIAHLRTLPDGDSIIQANFLDEDLNAAMEHFWSSDEWQNTLAILQPQPGAWVLDYGAGRCITSAAFSRLGCRVVALDINSSPQVGLGVLRRYDVFRRYPVYGVLGDAEYRMFPPETFDIVYCREALHHAFDLEKLVGNLIRVLKPGGTFFAYGEHRHPFWSNNEQFRRIHPAVQFGVNENSYRESVYRRTLMKAGLSQVKIAPIVTAQESQWSDPWHYKIAARLGHLPLIGRIILALYVRLRLYRIVGSQVTIVGYK